uniref:CSON011612 protein n=1 Tax=Culicoides sonorensis TaxID=179676 RepID=A0A336MFL5_CULSO
MMSKKVTKQTEGTLFYLFFFVQVLNLMLNSVTACQLLATGLTARDREEILHIHNKYRSAVALGKIPNQPPAQNMQMLKWDYSLEKIAQNWANNCQYKHNKNRHISERFYVGENIAQIWSTAPLNDEPFTATIEGGWFNEYKIYKFGQAVGQSVGHYTQWVWADTSLVGCGISYYYEERTRRYTKFYVCDYGPAGNIRGEEPYVKGKPSCNIYGMKFSKKYPGLCLS